MENRRFSKETPKTKRVRVTPLDRNREKTVTRVTPGRVSAFEPPLSETPSTKPQAPEKLPISNTNPQKQMPGQTARRSVFELGASLELGIWNLELFAWALSFSKIEMRLSHLKNLFELRQVPWTVAGDVGHILQTDTAQFRIIKPRLDRHDVAGAQSVV